MERRLISRWVERLLVTALTVIALYRLGPQLQAWTGVGPDLGRAPSYSFTALDGSSIDSDSLRGKVVVLNFWATWCGPCKLEMPALQRLHSERSKNGVLVLGLATDIGHAEAITEFLDNRGITYPVGRATNRHTASFGGINAIPTTFIIDRNGVVQHRVIGYFAPPAMRAAVERLLSDSSSVRSDSSAETISYR